MSQQLSAEEVKKHNIERMSEALGTRYTARWQELAVLHLYWAEYKELFGTKPARIDLMNQAAPAFFHMLQEELWDNRLMHLARITDSPKSVGKDNLTVRNLPDLIDDARLKAKVAALVDIALDATKFCRDWRNRRIGHIDLALATGAPAAPLAETNRKQVNEALKAIADVMNALDAHYFDSETMYDRPVRMNGALEFLFVLNDGIKARDARDKRIEAGEYRTEDLTVDDV
ncbi:hypothetical protein [Bradyrhizobium erythrophlei]|uniref:HEPN AbiU2-like domain-containing protein n=1 Tax=Bradyrhizobium erythrophlei TaxID=1437360 RepID=A0A1H4XI33_9BRAD|nr:hypothetical protein [Bradyrhizobium erythrophlei]SED04541.1 hypothetical protein SAMN05444164_3516 [Bradyrhizobium erythrophlei]